MLQGTEYLPLCEPGASHQVLTTAQLSKDSFVELVQVASAVDGKATRMSPDPSSNAR
jgi:hypothetical protein